MEFTLEEAEVFAPIEEGSILAANLTKLEKVTKPWTDDKTGLPVEKMSFEFTITDPRYKGLRMWGETSLTFNNHPNCKLRAWVTEIMGEDDLPVGFKFNTDTIVNLPARIVVAHRQTKNADGSTGVREYVGDVIRASSVPTANDVF